MVDNISLEDAMVINTCVSFFLRTPNAKARDIMSKSIRFILDKYGIPRLEMERFTVRASGDRAVVEAIEWVNDKRCPGCEAPIYPDDSVVHILSIRENQPEGYDEVSYGCRCGRLFRKLECNQD